eukprot:5279568-Pleurochrysis_carterae.AAC.1
MKKSEIKPSERAKGESEVAKRGRDGGRKVAERERRGGRAGGREAGGNSRSIHHSSGGAMTFTRRALLVCSNVHVLKDLKIVSSESRRQVTRGGGAQVRQCKKDQNQSRRTVNIEWLTTRLCAQPSPLQESEHGACAQERKGKLVRACATQGTSPTRMVLPPRRWSSGRRVAIRTIHV